MENIFKEVKFGDRFLCRDGTKAIFIDIIHSDDFNKDFARLIDEVTCKIQCFNLNGLKSSESKGIKLNCDIVSRYKEEIDEVKLNHLATEYAEANQTDYGTYTDGGELYEGFEAGYRKAMEG